MRHSVWIITCLFLVGCGSDRGWPTPEVEDSIINLDDTIDEDVGVDVDMGVDTSSELDVAIDNDSANPDATPDQVVLDILLQLRAAPNVTAVEELRKEAGRRVFVVSFEQPLNHLDPDGRTFAQVGFLFHTDESAPMTLITSGYGLGEAEDYRQFAPVIATELQSNVLFLGHRFFSSALPEPVDQDWQFLDIEQAANDNHLITQSLREVYTGSWIGTGWSKGGMTAIFHEFHFPNDLDVVIPMVAPISFSRSDERYPPFLATIGTEECRDRLDVTMLGSLDRVDELVSFLAPPFNQVPLYRDYTKRVIITKPWAYWQYFGIDGCDFIPAADAPVETLVNFFFYNQLSPRAELLANDGIAPRPIRPDEAGLIAYSYQGATQLGFQSSYVEGILDRMVTLGYLTESDKASYEGDQFANGLGADYPWGANTPPHDPAPMQNVDRWLREDATDMLAVYGEFDPWTGGKVTLSGVNNSKVYIAPTRSHSTRLTDLTTEDYNDLMTRVYELIGSPVSSGSLFRVPTTTDSSVLDDLIRRRLL